VQITRDDPRPDAMTAAEPAGQTTNRIFERHSFHGFVTYQPAGRYWAFQGIEAGIFLLLAAILLTVTAVVLLRRDA
jgi:hypothetical protein